MKKTIIVYGEYDGIENNAIKLLSNTILDYTMKYPVCVCCKDFTEDSDARCIFIGTKENNPFIKKLSSKVLSHNEEYYIKVENDNIIIEGSDPAGVLYGCVDFEAKYITPNSNTHNHLTYFKNIFEDTLPDFEYSSHPSIKERGLWTWGHVIYDYKGYIDNMVLLKMNTLIVWNDFVPVNAKEMIEYAHNNNIRVIWGFPWGWDTACGEIDVRNIDKFTDGIIAEYENSYAPLGVDGIYFQSFTEVNEDTIDGVLVADAVTEFVNKTADIIFAKYPDLELQFGLHATSVRNKLEYIKKVNPKITIVWEDCGAFPFHYLPEMIDDFEDTCDLTRKIMSLRGENERFGTVLKGLVCLDWTTFEHQEGSYMLGTSSLKMQKNRTDRKRDIWRYVQAYWLRNADKAYDMIKLMKEESNGKTCVTALVEDGMFETKLCYPVALFGQMLWDCDSNLKDLMCETALSDYVEFI